MKSFKQVCNLKDRFYFIREKRLYDTNISIEKGNCIAEKYIKKYKQS